MQESSEPATEDENDAPGTLELLVDMEGAMPAATEALNAINAATKAVGLLFSQANPDPS